VRALQNGAADYLVKGGLTDSMRARSVAMPFTQGRRGIRQGARGGIGASFPSRHHGADGVRPGARAQPTAGRDPELCKRVPGPHRKQWGSPATALTAIQEVMNETRRAGAIINRMRSFVSIQQPETVPLDMNELVRESVSILDFELRHRRIHPHLALAGNLPQVLGDAVPIQQVLVNLLFNAVQAIGESNSPRMG